MTEDQPTSVRMLVTAEQIAEIRRLLADEPGALAILPPDDRDALRAALAFYADPANWREGCGTGPGRLAPCVADGGKLARKLLACAERTNGGDRDQSISEAAMGVCQIEEINKGGAYPKSCPTCKFGPRAKGLPDPFAKPSQAPCASASPLPIDFAAGDNIVVRVPVERLSTDKRWPMVRLGMIVAEVDPMLVTSIERGPRPLKVGDRVLFQETPQTVVAVDHGSAWIRDDVGVGQICQRNELSHLDGRVVA